MSVIDNNPEESPRQNEVFITAETVKKPLACYQSLGNLIIAFPVNSSTPIRKDNFMVVYISNLDCLVLLII